MVYGVLEFANNESAEEEVPTGVDFNKHPIFVAVVDVTGTEEYLDAVRIALQAFFTGAELKFLMDSNPSELILWPGDVLL